MKTKLKIQRRLGAWMLAVLFLMQALFSVFWAEEIQAASYIGEWDENTLVDYQYRFNVKYQQGVTTAVPFGCDNQDSEALSNHGRNGINAVTNRMTDGYVPDSAGIRYYNAGKDQYGNIVDFQVSVVSVTNAEPRYDMFTPYTKYHLWHDGKEDNGDGYAWENGMGQPIVGFSLDSIGVFIYCIGSVKVHFQFFKHNTDEPLAISGHGTVQDLDAGQGVSIPSDSNIDYAYILKGNTFLEVNGTSVQAGNEGLEISDKNGWLNFLYQTDSIYFNFLHQSRLDRWDKEREDGIAKRDGSEERWAKMLRETYVDPDGNSYCANFQGGKIVRSHAYFDFTSYCLGDVEMKKEPEKRVGAVGSTWEESVDAAREMPYLIDEYEDFQYMIQTEVTPNHFQSFVVQDTLKDCLAIDNTSKIIIKNDVGDEVTGWFSIRIDGQTITCEAKPEYLELEEFTDNQLYTFIFQVHRKEGADLSNYLTQDGYTFLIPNSATMSYVRLNGKGETKSTGTVWVQGQILPELVIEKAASGYEWSVGDEVSYTVKVTQKKAGAWAINTVVEDLSIPSCLQLIDGQYMVETSPGVEHCVISKEGGNGWRATCPLLQYDESIQITYRCKALESSNGQEWINTVSATADNFIDKTTKEKKEVRDLAEVWVNGAQLEIDKTADKYEWQVGDEIQYRIVVSNTMPGTIARDVYISDMELPEGLMLSGGTSSVTIENAPVQADYPVADHKTGQTTENRVVDSYLEGDGSGFRFYCSYLPYSYPVTILFHCTATESADGHECVNVASVRAENAREKADDAESYINTGNFLIEKTASHYEWQVGEQVEYQVVVENQMPGTIARNVTIWDTDMPAGLILSSPDAVRILGIPETIVNPVSGSPDVPGQLNPEAYQETEWKEVSYEFVPEGNGWRLSISDLPAGTPVTITFLCDVTEAVNGMESINAAYVRAENAPEQADDSEIYVNTAMLTIDKSVNNHYLEQGDGRYANEFRTGEQVEYQVVVTNKQKGSIARNVVISDLSLPQELAVDGASDALAVYGIPQVVMNPVAGTDDMGNRLDPKNYNEVEEKQVSYQLVRQGTGWVLTISDLPYDVPVTVVFRSVVIPEILNGWEITNTVKAYADNASEVKDSAKIWVNRPSLVMTKKADKPYYQNGDIASYQIKVTQENTGCAAKNLVISDTIEQPGAKLLKDSIVLLDQNGNILDAEVQIHDDNSFTIYTGYTLVKAKNYWIYDAQQGGACEQVLYSPLENEKVTEMTIEYQVLIQDESLAGQTIRNIATADSDEKNPVNTEEIVEVYSPVLDIVKESDQKEYFVGETGYYKLIIRQRRKNITAENIVIEDTMNDSGIVFDPGSILIKKNNVILDSAVVELLENGYRITTKTALTDVDKLEIFYNVTFKNPSLDGAFVVNTAVAWGDNTPPTVTENEVYVGDIRPDLLIEKSSDKEVYEPGETGHYLVKVTQTERDATARNVVLKDVLGSTKAELVKDSVRVFDRKGVLLDRPEIEETVSGYLIHTGMELAYDEFLTVEYDVKFPEDIQETEVTNVAMAKADNSKNVEEKVAEPVSVGDGITALKTSNPVSGSVVESNGLITYFIEIRNNSAETKTNIMVKDAIPKHTTFEKSGEIAGEIMEIDGQDYVTFFIDEIRSGEGVTVSFSVKCGELGMEDCIVNLARVRQTIANKKDVTLETWKSPRFFNTNATIHYSDSLWVKTENQVTIKTVEATPGVNSTVTPIATNIPTPSGNPTPQPTAEISSKLTPVATQSSSGGASNSGISPTAANSGIATSSRTDTSSGTSVNSGSSMGTYSSGSSYTSGYGNYQSSSTAGSAKTGETRPFTVMARIGILGLLLLALGSFFFIKTKKREHEDE